MQAAPPSSQKQPGAHHATSFSRCLSDEMAPEKRKVPHPLPGRAFPAPAAGEKKHRTSLGRQQPDESSGPPFFTSTTSPRPRPRPRSRSILTSPVFRPNSSSSLRDGGCYKTVRHRFCTYPEPARLCLLPLPPRRLPPPHLHDPWQWARPELLFSSRPSLLLSLGSTPLPSLVDTVIFVLFFPSRPPRHYIRLVPKSTRKDPRSRR